MKMGAFMLAVRASVELNCGGFGRSTSRHNTGLTAVGQVITPALFVSRHGADATS
jgi:hypothetical protein